MNKRKRSGLLALLLVGMLGGGIAFAAWLTNGTGSLGGRAGDAQQFLVIATTPATDLLYPGGTGILTGTVTNPNDYPVQVQSVTLGAITTSNPDCDASNVSFPTVTLTGLTVVAPADSAGTVLALPNAIAMDADAADECKNVTFTVAVTATGTSVP